MGGEIQHIGYSMFIKDDDQRRAGGAPERPEVSADDVRDEVARVIDAALNRWLKEGRADGLPGVGTDYVYWVD